MNNLKKIKAWIVYGGSSGWYNATLILENGWVPFSHSCSHPCFMPGDLIENRKERKEALEKMGYEIDLQMQPVAGSNDPSVQWLVEKHQNKENWQEMAEQYKNIVGEDK